MTDKYFLDTYALIAIANGEEQFKPYIDDDIITLKENIVELYYFLLRKYNLKTADYFLNKFASIAHEFTLPLIRTAMAFKEQHKKENFSYIDCLGYTYSRENNRLFVTGDNAFRNLNAVKFVQ